MSEIEKLDKGADMTRMSKEALWYDDAILHYRYHKVQAEGQKYEGGHYVTMSVRVGRQMLPAIRAVKDDREVLGDIAKQLVIAGIPFRLVSVR